MKSLLDNCAILFSVAGLYNGMASKNAMIAVFPKNNIAQTLIKDETLNPSYDMASMMLQEKEIIPFSFKINKHLNYITVCVAKQEGTETLEKYLREQQFIELNDENIATTAEQYFRETEIQKTKKTTQNSLSGKGRAIAAAVTLGHIRLSGKHACAASKDNDAIYNQVMNMPMDMGHLKLILKKESKKDQKALVYINGSLRVIVRSNEEVNPHNVKVWEVFPKFDSYRDEGVVIKNALEDFLDPRSNGEPAKFTASVNEQVHLGCPDQ